MSKGTGPRQARPAQSARAALVGPLSAYRIAIAERERQDAPLPVSLPVTLTTLGAWGVALVPKPPFWVFGPLAVLAAVRRRRSARMS